MSLEKYEGLVTNARSRFSWSFWKMRVRYLFAISGTPLYGCHMATHEIKATSKKRLADDTS